MLSLSVELAAISAVVFSGGGVFGWLAIGEIGAVTSDSGAVEVSIGEAGVSVWLASTRQSGRSCSRSGCLEVDSSIQFLL